jgi:hypothetical protein
MGTLFSKPAWVALSDRHQGLLAYGYLVDLLLMVAVLAYNLVLLTLFTQKKRSFPVHLVAFYVVANLLTLFGQALARLGSSDASRLNSALGGIVGAIFVQALWSAYVFRSRRAALTFVVR